MQWEIFWLHRVIDIEDWATAVRSGNGLGIKNKWRGFTSEGAQGYAYNRGEAPLPFSGRTPPLSRLKAMWSAVRSEVRFLSRKKYNNKEYEYFANKEAFKKEKN